MSSTTKNNSILPLNKVLKFILPLFSILLIWEIAYLAVGNSYIIPSVSKTVLRAFKMFAEAEFYTAIFTAFIRVFCGLALGILFGVVIALLCHYSTIAAAIVSPIVSIMKATPIACIIVLLWISMSYTQITIFVVLLMVLPIVWQNIYNGLSNMDKDLIEVSAVFEFSFIKKIRFLIFPSMLKYLIPSVITSIGLAWKSGIAAEIMTNSNIGRLIYNYKNITYDTESIFAWTVMIVLFSILLEKATAKLLGRFSNDS